MAWVARGPRPGTQHTPLQCTASFPHPPSNRVHAAVWRRLQADEGAGRYWQFVEGLQALEQGRATPDKCWRMAVEKAKPLVLPPLAKVGGCARAPMVLQMPWNLCWLPW